MPPPISPVSGCSTSTTSSSTSTPLLRPSYLELYDRYQHQRWNVHDLDFTRDQRDWAGMPEEAKQTFLQIASGFHHGERQVEVELAPLFFGIPEGYKIFLASQLEDEARHVVFFDRF